MATQPSTFLWTSGEAPGGGTRTSDKPTVAGLPGEVGLWVFVLGDMTIFGAFFAVFARELRSDRATFGEAAAALYQPIGVANTLLLLVSSYAVVVALHAYRQRRSRATQHALGVAMLCGLAFIGSKAVEYSLEIGGGHTPGSNTYFTFYYVMTGVHLLHVLIGLVLLGVWVKAGRSGASPGRGYVEGAAVYWHMVDLLWIVIFGLLYLGAGS